MKYEAPNMEFVAFCTADVIAASIEAGDNSLQMDIFDILSIF